MQTQPDPSLLKAIVEQRSDAAFAELYTRYEKRALNLAMRILRDRTLAQDAVQEAMLSIWRSTDAALPEGDTGQWIMKIVAHKSINLGVSRKRVAKREERVGLEQNRAQVSVAAQTENNELVCALRSQIDQLPELETTLLAGCFGAGMSHQELADVVGMPRRTVTNKIQQALERLRLSLSKAGVASAAPLVSTESLFEALTTGHECSPGMMEGVLSQIKAAGSEATAMSRRARNAAKPARMFLPSAIIAMAGVAASGAAGWWIWNVSVPVAPPTASTSQTEGVAPFSHSWKAPFDFSPMHGKWSYEAQGDMSGFMTVRSNQPALIRLPASIHKQAGVISVRARKIKDGDWTFGLFYEDPVKIPAPQHIRHLGWPKFDGSSFFSRQADNATRTIDTYLLDQYLVGVCDGHVFMVRRYDTPFPSHRVGMMFMNFGIEEIGYRSVQKDGLPRELQDIEATIAKLGVKPLRENQVR